MAVLIDTPLWPAHGRLWSHLVSDTSLGELHEFASRVGLPARGFEGDHYDVPQERYADLVAAGAVPTDRRGMVRALQASGLRLSKRRGDRGVALVRDVTFADGTSADIALVESATPVEERRVFAASVFLRDARGDLVVVHSRRRNQWGPPGGWREGDEPVVGTATRETWEETGIRLEPALLRPVGYERFAQRSGGAGLWRPGQDLLQVYAAELDATRPPLEAALDDTTDRAWVTWAGFADRCRGEFWWPLAEAVLAGR